MVFCTNCGHKNSENQKFCVNCGAPLRNANASQQTSQNQDKEQTQSQQHDSQHTSTQQRHNQGGNQDRTRQTT